MAPATPDPSSSPSGWVIVGLGNPGPRYAGNRHNVGAMVLAELASRARVTFGTHKSRAAVAETYLGAPGSGQRVVLAVPRTFMNDSGGAVKAVLAYVKATPERLVVVHDELDIDAGRVRVKFGGGEGGHNGLRSISTVLGTRDYYRVRVGIGRPPGRMDPADYVLHDFAATERADLGLRIGESADAVESLLGVGLVATQQRFHS